MAEFLLIHGSCFQASCWHRLIPELVALGHTARAIDLPRRAFIDASLQDQADTILANLDTPAILVGHSAGGVPITAAAETDPSHIRALVYLCAYAPDNGASVAALRRRQREQPLRPALRIDRQNGSYRFDPDQAEALFFHDCPATARNDAMKGLTPEAIIPQESPVTLSPRSQDLPRFYITCENDRAIPPAFQREMARTVPPENRFTLATGHSPFLADPVGTAELLARIASLTA